MDPLKLALQIEKDGEAFYLELASRERNPELQVIFRQLAADEAKHYLGFQNIRQQPALITPTTVLPDAANLFRRMIAKDSLQNFDESHLVLYKEAMVLEERSRDFYQEQAATSIETASRDLFQTVAAEEEKHYWLLQNIYELVLRPQTWVENGEFNHLEDY